MAKKAYKVKENRMICGVCTGVAEYLNLDVSLVRIVWAAAAFTGFGLLLYLFAAVILPEKG